jgi:hypothetical protein
LFQYTSVYDANGITAAGIFPALLANLSRLENFSLVALGLISVLVENNDNACQLILSNCLTPLILSPDIVCYEELIDCISQGTKEHLTKTFTEIFNRKLVQKTQTTVLQFFLKILRSWKSISDALVQAISTSNLVKYTLEALLFVDDDEFYVKTCLDIISSYGSCCHRITTEDGGVLESFIPCIKKHRAHWNVLLPCLSEIIKTLDVDLHSKVPSDLISVLLSLEICEEVMTCVLGICDRTLTLDDTQFLQHLVDNDLLTFLTSALCMKLKLRSNGEVINLLQRIMRADEKYFAIVTSSNLPRSVNRTVMKGFL